MSEIVTVEWKGLRELEEKLNRLSEDISKRGVIRAGRAGLRVWKKAIDAAAREKFKRRTGDLFRAIRTGFRITPRGLAGVRVRFYVYLHSKGFYGRIWELGFMHTGRAKRSKLGSLGRGQGFFSRAFGKTVKGRRGRGKARSRAAGTKMQIEWMRPAAEAAGPAAMDATISELHNFLQEYRT